MLAFCKKKQLAETTQQIAVPHGIPWVSGKRQPPSGPSDQLLSGIKNGYYYILRRNQFINGIVSTIRNPKEKNTIIFPMFKLFFFGGGNLVSRETGFPSHWISAPPTGISGWMWRALMPKHLGELFRCVFHRWFDEQHHKSQPPAGYSRRQVL